MAEIPPPMIGIFADGAEMQAGTGLIQEPPHHNRQHQCQIEEQAVAEQQLARDGDILQPLREDGLGEELLEVVAQRNIAALMDAHIFARELADARAEDGESEAGDVLVRAERDGQE